MSVPQSIAEFLQPDKADRQYELALNAVVGSCSHGSLALADLVAQLGPSLTSDASALRGRAVLLMAEVIGHVPGLASTPTELSHVAEFFSSKFSDWPCLRGTTKGSLALLRRMSPATLLPPSDVLKIAQAVTASMDAHTLPVADRITCFQLLLALVERDGGALVDAGVDLLEASIAMLDGEQDPRCLLLGFECVRALARLYEASGPAAQQRLADKAEDLCDVLACYFPVVYTPPPTRGEEKAISREELACAVERTLAASPAFAPYVIPLLLDKLASSLGQTKADACAALVACAQGNTLAGLRPHLKAVWASLRTELVAAGEVGAGEDAARAAPRAAAAAACLTSLIAAVDSPQEGTGSAGGELAGLVLGDPLVLELWEELDGSQEAGANLGRAAARIAARARTLAAVAGGSAAAADRVHVRVGSRLLALAARSVTGLARGADDHQCAPACLALAAALPLVAASVRCAPGEPSTPPLMLARDGHLAGAILAVPRPGLNAGGEAGGVGSKAGGAVGSQLLRGGGMDEEAPGSADASGEEGGLEEEAGVFDTDEVDVLQCRLAAVALAVQKPGAVLSADDEARVLRERLLPGLAPGRPARVAAASAMALSKLAGGASGELLLASAVLPPLLHEAAGHGHEADTHPWRGGPALRGLTAIYAAGTPVLQARVLRGLAPALERPGGGAERPAAVASAVAGKLCAMHVDEAATAEAVADALGCVGAALLGGCVRLGQPEEPDPEMPPGFMRRGPRPAAAPSALNYGNPPPVGSPTAPNRRSQDATSISEAIAAYATAAHQAVSLLPATAQQQLASNAANLLIAWNSQPRPQASAAEPARALPVAAAMLAALRLPPHRRTNVSIPEPDMLDSEQLLDAAVHAALRLEDALAARWASAAVASLLNKWPTEPSPNSPALDAVADRALSAAKAQATDAGAGVEERSQALHLLGAVAWALAQRGHTDALRAISFTTDLLRDASHDAGEAGAAAEILETLLSGPAPPGRVAHTAPRVLWQQRAFTQALQFWEAAAGPVEGGTPPALLLGLGRLVRGAPGPVVAAALPRLVPSLLGALRALPASGLGQPPVLLALLLALNEALMDPRGREAMEVHAGAVLGAFCAAAEQGPSGEVRATAAECLLAAMSLPYAGLHPHRRAVNAALTRLLDDKKRPVRAAAARARFAWNVV